MTPRETPTTELLREIEVLQNVQRKYPPTHPWWQQASQKLAPRFEEMARRQREHGHETVE